MAKHLVTGGAGFIGSHVVDALISRGHEVVVLDDLSTGSRDNVNPAAELVEMDLCDPRVSDFIRNGSFDGIFHLAAQASVPLSVKDPVRDTSVNVLASVQLLKVASDARVRRFIFASTGGALSSEAVMLPTDEEHASEPQSPYAIAKVAVEFYGAFFRRSFGLPFTAFRLANVYGPRQNPHGEAGVVAIFCKRMLSDSPLAINGDGLQTRDYIYVSDVVNAFMIGLDNKNAEGPYHVGTGIETDVQTIFKIMKGITGYARDPGQGPSDVGAPRRSALDSIKFIKEMGWKPEVKLAEGLEKTIAWFRGV